MYFLTKAVPLGINSRCMLLYQASKYSNITFPFQQFCQNFVALNNDGNFHMEDFHLFLESYRKQQISTPVMMFQRKSTSFSAVLTTNPHALVVLFLSLHSWYMLCYVRLSIIHLDKCWNGTANWVTTTCFHNFSNSLLTDNPIIQHYIV